MIHYIFAAAFGALIGSQSKKSKKSYADGGLIVSWFDKDINYQSKRFDTKKMEDAKRFFYQKQSEYLKPTLTTYDNDVILDSTYAKGGKMFVPQGREILYQDENVALQHNKVTDHYSMINPDTGVYMAKGGKTDDLGNPTEPKILEKMEIFIKNEIPKLDKGRFFTDGMQRKEAKKRFYQRFEYGAYNPKFSFDFAKGGEVSSVVNNLQKGDLLKIKFGSIASRDNEVSLKVRSRNKIRNGRIDKITFENVNNPDGARFYAYERGNGVFSFAMGDLAISNIEIVSDYAKGGMTEHGLQLGDKIIGAGKNSINVVTKKGGQKKVDLSEGTRESFAKGGKTLPRPAKDFIAYVIDMDGNATLKYSKTFQGANRMMKNLMKKIQDVSTHGISKYDPFYGTRVGKMFFEPIKGFAKGGMTEHGLEIGDKIIKEKDNAVLVVTKDEKNASIVNLDKGIRANFAKGGETNFIQQVVDSPDFRKGAFTKKAKERGLTPEEFMSKVLKNPDKYDERTRKQAQFMKNITD